jgi:hypothetical protein
VYSAAAGGRTLITAPTGEHVISSASHGSVESTESALLRRSSVQASRRAVLHVQAPGDPVPQADLASWFTERAFHFYAARLRLPARAGLSARQAGRDLRPAFADLDAACAHLRRADGMATVIVTAQGRAAVAAALWTDRRTPGSDWPPADGWRAAEDWQAPDDRRPADGWPPTGADALMLSAPAWPARRALHLNIACPVLVIAGQGAAAAASPVRSLRPLARARAGARGRGAPVRQLGSHVTWLALPGTDADRQAYLAELGRWLGAYMYGQVRDQLL